ncbi:MAG: ABC transporter permease, partial [Anaerolineaceae bacterium]|nr:ABC transporter permease [Anaerolineaceae bacterium]
AIILPGGFDAAVLSGKQPLVSLTVKDGQTTTDTLQRIVQGALVKTISAVQTGQWVAGKVGEQRSLSATESQQLIMNTAQDYNAAWLSSALKVELTPLSNPELVNKRNPYTQSSPGMIVQFVIFGLITCANIIVVERKSGTLDRLRTTSMGRAEIIAGHMLAMFVLIFTQETILIVFGSLVLKVGYLSQPLATLVMMIAMAIWSASLGLLIGVLASNEERVILYSLGAMFVFTSLGGAWFPLDVSGKAFSTIGHFTPAAWAMDGLQNIILRGLGLNSVLLPAAILLGYTALFFGLAVWKFRKI